MKRKILIVEDERPILDGLIDLFTFHGYDVTGVADGRLGLERALAEKFDLIILDVMLPSLDGFAVCNELRSKDRTTPIVMLTAKSSEEDILAGLSLGADDYVSKPFSIRELVLRVEAILRRTAGNERHERYLNLAGALTIDCANLQATRDGSGVIEFTRREIELLRYLVKRGDVPASRTELLSELWGYARASEIETRTVDIHIAKLRKKIERDAKNPEYLVTLRGEGYKLLHASFSSRLEQP